MKVFLYSFLISSVILSSCGKRADENSSSLDSLALQDSLRSLNSSQWIIPLTQPITTKNFLLVLASDQNKIPLYTRPASATIKPGDFIADTTQTNWVSELSYDNKCSPDNDIPNFLEVADKKQWISATQALIIDQLDLGTFNIPGGKTLKLGSMRPLFQPGADLECSLNRTLFLYDDHFLYLVDIDKSDEDGFIHWGNDPYLSLVGAPPGIGMQGTTEGDIFAIRWSVPNGNAQLKLSFSDGHVKSKEYSMEAIQGDFEEGMEGEGDDVSSEEKVAECEFQDYSIGDCGHMEFSCGDFGNALTNKLSEEDKALWSDLSISDDNGERGNPKYVGKTFTIIYTMVKGDLCGDPSGPQYGDIEQLISFKLTNVN